MNQEKTVVLIHGHGVDSTIWDGIYDQLAMDYQLVKPDFSALTNHNTIEAYAEDLFSKLQTAQINKAVLVGHSMGGYIALALAERHPDMVSGLVLFNSTAFADDEERKAKRQVAIDQIQKEGNAAFIDETIPKMFSEASKAKLSEQVQKRAESAKSLSADALASGIRAIAGRPDRSKVIQEAKFPVLIVAGKEDNLVPFEKSQQLAELLNEKGEFIAMDEVSHLGMVEKPEEAVKLLREFLVRA